MERGHVHHHVLSVSASFPVAYFENIGEPRASVVRSAVIGWNLDGGSLAVRLKEGGQYALFGVMIRTFS